MGSIWSPSNSLLVINVSAELQESSRNSGSSFWPETKFLLKSVPTTSREGASLIASATPVHPADAQVATVQEVHAVVNRSVVVRPLFLDNLQSLL